VTKLSAAVVIKRVCAAPLFLLFAAGAMHAQLLPTKPGATWHYHVTDSAAPRAATHVVTRITGTEQMSGEELLRVETAAGGVVLKTELLSVNDNGVQCHRRTSHEGKLVRFNPPQVLFPAKLKPGVSWTFVDVQGQQQAPQEFTIAGHEEIAVPAGVFRAWRVESEQEWPFPQTISRWFVPGTGVVKEITSTRNPGGRLIGRTTSVLKNFSMETAESLGDSPPALATAGPIVETPHEPRKRRAKATPASKRPKGEPVVAAEVSSTPDGDAATEFSSDVPNLYVHWMGDNLPPGAQVRIAWVAEDVGDVAPKNYTVDESATVAAKPKTGGRMTLSRPPDGWVPGRYRAEVYVADQLEAAAYITIQE
jgi:hypothetical protein